MPKRIKSVVKVERDILNIDYDVICNKYVYLINQLNFKFIQFHNKGLIHLAKAVHSVVSSNCYGLAWRYLAINSPKNFIVIYYPNAELLDFVFKCW